MTLRVTGQQPRFADGQGSGRLGAARALSRGQQLLLTGPESTRLPGHLPGSATRTCCRLPFLIRMWDDHVSRSNVTANPGCRAHGTERPRGTSWVPLPQATRAVLMATKAPTPFPTSVEGGGNPLGTWHPARGFEATV